MAITDFTDIWIIHFDSISYLKYKEMIRKGMKNKLKEWILKKYIVNFQIQYMESGKPYIISENQDTIYFSFTSIKNLAIMSVSNSDIGVDMVYRKQNLLKLINWVYPLNKLLYLSNTKSKHFFMLLSQEAWCKIEASVKLSGHTLLDFLRIRERTLKLFGDIFFETLVMKKEICVIAKRTSFTINRIYHIDFNKLYLLLGGNDNAFN